MERHQEEMGIEMEGRKECIDNFGRDSKECEESKVRYVKLKGA